MRKHLDYVYNLQGWLKGVNATSLTNTLDPGKDGVTTGANPVNGNFAKDVFAFSLHYHQGDYTPIGATAPAATINLGSHAAANSSDLYNGNIRFMQTTLTNPTTREAMPMLNAYRYDQLNRLAQSRSYENGFSANEWNPTSYANNYFNAFTFDAMGNILTQKRHKRDGTQIEDMTYRYKYDVNNKLLRNRLYHVNDAIAANLDDTDIDDMGAFVSNPLLIETANNYSYDEEGRLIKDTQEGIERITWRVDGKVKSIERPSDSGKKNVSFEYDAFGRRIAKHVFDDDWNLEKSTYYILDAQGNQLSMYEHTVDSNQVNFTLAERNIYGSSRLGRTNLAVNMYSSTQEAPISEVLGYKNYELSNHLGNVLTVINDIKIPLSDDNETVSGYDAGIVSIWDYSPFGVQLDGRTVSASSYRYGYQSSEKDDEIKGKGNSYTTHYRLLDPRIGRWLSVDPKARLLPWESPYISMGDNPVCYNDILGDKWKDPAKDGAKAKDIHTKLGNRSNELFKQGEKLASKAESMFDKVNSKYEKTGKYDEKKADKGFSKLDQASDLYRQAGEMKKAQGEIENMEKSSVEFTFQQITAQDGLHYTYMDNNGTIVVEYSSDEVLVHELTHAHQHLTGDIKYIPSPRPGAAYYVDIQDEVEAYRRQYIFSPITFNTPSYYRFSVSNWKQINSNWVRQVHTPSGQQPYNALPEF